MLEGDTIYRTADVLRRVLQGKRLTGFDTTVPQVAAACARHVVVGLMIHDVTPWGKHLLIAFRDLAVGPSADLVLHTHMRLTGSWHLYHAGVPWKKPLRFAKGVPKRDQHDHDDRHERRQYEHQKHAARDLAWEKSGIDAKHR